MEERKPSRPVRSIESSPWAHNSKYVIGKLDDHTKLLDRVLIDVGELRLEVSGLQTKAGLVAGLVSAVATALLTWLVGKL